jgi:hypothetical protein
MYLGDKNDTNNNQPNDIFIAIIVNMPDHHCFSKMVKEMQYMRQDSISLSGLHLHTTWRNFYA